MVMIAIAGQQTLTQWDVGRKLIITEKCSSVHYANPSMTEAIVCAATENEGVWMAPIPDEVLQVAGKLRVYAFVGGDEGYTKETKDFLIKAKPKPENYIFAPTEAMTWEGLHERISALEESGGGSGGSGTNGEDGYSVLYFTGAVTGGTVIVANITKPDGYTVKKGDMLVSADGLLYQVASDVYTDVPGEVADVELLGTLKGKDGYTPQKGTDYFDGEDGADGKAGNGIKSAVLNADYTLTLTFDDGTSYTTPSIRGATGEKGDPGIAPVVEVIKSGKTTSITVADPETGEILGAADIEDGAPGADGQRGRAILRVNTSTTSASGTGPTGVAIKYKIALDTVKSEAGVDEVLVGDTVLRSYYLYPVANVDASYVYLGAYTSIRGATGSAGATGADGYTPVKGVDYYTDADKAEMVEAVKVSMDGIPDYWVSALETGAEAVNTALCNAGYNKSAFLFYTDAHWNYGSQMSPTLLKYLYRHTGMNKTFFGGDIVNNEASDYDTMAYLWDWRKQLKDLPNHHSVVGNHDDGNSTNNLFSKEYVYAYLLAAEETSDIVRGEDGLYYYIDSPAEKTRYLCLDTAFKGLTANQSAFVVDALKTTPDGWHVVAIAHVWVDTDYTVSPPVPGDINADAAQLLAMFDNYNSRSGEYADCGGWVEFCIGGHTHWDYDITSETGIPVILVETDSQHVRSGLGFELGTTTEASVNGIVADYDAHEIHVVRIGRGESRTVEVTNYVVSYTNLIPTAVDTDGVTIYNGVGYKENVRMSASSGQFKDNTGSCCTGYIPIPTSDTSFTVYLKNIVNNTSNNYGCGFNFFNGTGVAITNNVSYDNLEAYGYSPVFDADGNVIQITVDNSKQYTHMAVAAVTINASSIITINEPIE